MAGNRSCWSTGGSGNHCVVEELFSERAGGPGDCCCPGRISGEPEAYWVFCGLRLEGGVSRLFSLTGSALSYSQDCINIC